MFQVAGLHGRQREELGVGEEKGEERGGRGRKSGPKGQRINGS